MDICYCSNIGPNILYKGKYNNIRNKTMVVVYTVYILYNYGSIIAHSV